MKHILSIALAATMATASVSAVSAGGLNEPEFDSGPTGPDFESNPQPNSLGSGGAVGILAPIAAIAILAAVALDDDDSD